MADMTPKAIKRWYAKHGLEYQPEDWELERDETGETLGKQTQYPDRRDKNRSGGLVAENLWWWEQWPYPWQQRTPEDREWVALLEEFFAPYLAMMSRAKVNLLYQYFADRMTFDEMGEDSNKSRQGVQQATKRAMRDLTRLIANDDPLFRVPSDARERDFDEEARAARRVLTVYLERRATSG